MLLLSESLPELANELKQLLTQQGEDALASEVPTLTIVDRCRCGDDFCSGFYTAPKPNGAYGPGHRNVVLDPANGMIILDVVHGSIQFVEVLYREDVKQTLDALLR
jgi:hypothetical protein